MRIEMEEDPQKFYQILEGFCPFRLEYDTLKDGDYFVIKKRHEKTLSPFSELIPEDKVIQSADEFLVLILPLEAILLLPTKEPQQISLISLGWGGDNMQFTLRKFEEEGIYTKGVYFCSANHYSNPIARMVHIEEE